MNTYKRLGFTEREKISRMLWSGSNPSQVAKILKRPTCTVTREIKRNDLNEMPYSVIKAQAKAIQRSIKPKQRKLNNNNQLKEYILGKLRLKWSPEQIAKRLKKEYPFDMNMRISHEAIYSYIYVLPRGNLKKELLSCLRQNKRERLKRGNSHSKRGRIKDMVSIEERPKEVENRIIPGHWEGDLIVGKGVQSALGTLVERTTRTTILVPLKEKDAYSVRNAFAKELKTLPKQMKISLTYDRGKEMAEHKLFTRQTKMKVYFAHPQSPWERGTNENTNGLIRQFFPKGTDFSQITKQEIKHAQDLLNDRPRKVLKYQTPYEEFNKLVALES